MKILELNQILAVSNNIVKYLKLIGHEVDYVRRNKYGEKIPAKKKYDLLHVHYAINSSSMKAFLRKIPAKKVVLHLHGSDVRELRYRYKPLLKFEKLRSDLILYSTPDLSQYTSGVWLPNFADLEVFKPVNKPIYSDRILVFHTIGSGKNSNLIKKVSQKLKGKYKFDFLQGVPYEKIPTVLQKYPLVLGQLSGSYGMCEIESMSCGVPTVFYPSPRTLSSIGSKSPSLLDLSVNSVVEFIGENIGNTKFGQMQRKFIEKYHNPKTISENLSRMFTDLLNDNLALTDREWGKHTTKCRV